MGNRGWRHKLDATSPVTAIVFVLLLAATLLVSTDAQDGGGGGGGGPDLSQDPEVRHYGTARPSRKR